MRLKAGNRTTAVDNKNRRAFLEAINEGTEVVLGHGTHSRMNLAIIAYYEKDQHHRRAVRLGKLFGDGDGIWVRMLAAYDAWNAEPPTDSSSGKSSFSADSFFSLPRLV
jgi:hypothetical protein